MSSLKDEIKELENNIAELKDFSKEKNIDFSSQISELEKQLEEKYKNFVVNFWWDIRIFWEKREFFLENPENEKNFIYYSLPSIYFL